MDASTNIFQPCINLEESVINWRGNLDTHDLIAGSSLMQLGDYRNTRKSEMPFPLQLNGPRLAQSFCIFIYIYTYMDVYWPPLITIMG